MYSIAKIHRVLNFVESEDPLKSKHNPHRTHSLQKAKEKFHIGSLSTIHKWQKNPPNLFKRSENLSKRGRRTLLSKDLQKKMSDFVDLKNQEKKRCNSTDIIEYMYTIAPEIKLSKQTVNNTVNRLGFSAHTTKKRPLQRLRSTYEEELEEVRSTVLNWAPSKVLAMDETGIWTNSVPRVSYARKGQRAEIATVDKVQRDTVAVTLRGDGTKLPLFYLQHRRASKRRNETAIKGMNIELMKKWVDEVLVGNVQGDELLLMDRLSSHKNKQVIKKIEDLGLTVMLFPAKTAPDLSPLDNSFFSEYKAKFAKYDKSTPEKKKEAAFKAYDEIPADHIKKYFKKCELIFDE